MNVARKHMTNTDTKEKSSMSEKAVEYDWNAISMELGVLRHQNREDGYTITRLQSENKLLHKRVAVALRYLREIGKPRLGGKLQQYAAQEALVKIAKI